MNTKKTKKPVLNDKIYYYTWGDEKPGFVSTWTLKETGEVKNLGQVERTQLPKNAVHNCPYA